MHIVLSVDLVAELVWQGFVNGSSFKLMIATSFSTIQVFLLCNALQGDR